MSIKGIVLAVVSALAGATLIAFGCYRAGLHSAAALKQENKELKKQNSDLEEDKKACMIVYDDLENRFKKLIEELNTNKVKIKELEKQNENLNEKDNVKTVNELEEKCKQLNEQLNNGKQINTKNQEQIRVLEETLKTLNVQMLNLAFANQDCANKANIYEEVIRTMEKNNQYIQHSDD